MQDKMKNEKIAPLGFLPIKLMHRLMPFQKDGILYAIEKNGCCLIADEMGLGKTLQALSVAYYFRHKWPLLIVVPASLKYPWVEEIEKWFPEIDPASINMILNGSDFGDIATSQITILSYGLLNRPSCKVVQEALVNQGFNFIIIDESHYMKNGRTATTKYLVPLLQKAEHKILLTGTPALSRPIELFPQVDAIQKGLFGDYFKFARKYCEGRFDWMAGKKRWRCDGASNLEELQETLTQQLMIRRLKKDVLSQLPPKVRQKIPFEVKDSTLKKEVDKINQELSMELQKLRLSMSDVFKRNPEMSESGNLFKVKNLMSKMYRETAKVKIGPVRDYVKMLCENRGLKFLIFAYHHNMMDGIAEELLDSRIKYIRIDGQTPSQERPALVKQFQQDEDTRVGILSIKAAGVGLTLTAAKLVIFSELDWTPGSLQQCEDRAHRIGQKETVHIHYLVAKGTLDEYVWSMLTRKTTVITTTLNGVKQTLQMEEGNQAQIDKLSKADVYVPPERSDDVSFAHILNNSQSNGQKSLLEFFSPHGSANLSKKCPKKRTKGKVQIVPTDTKDIVIIDDESPVKSNKRRIPSTEMEIASIDDEGNTSNDFASPPVKMMRFAPMSEEEGISGGSEKMEAKWSCSTCTFLNHEYLTYCEMCSAAKSQSQADPKHSSVTTSQDASSGTHVCEGNNKKSASTGENSELCHSHNQMKVKSNARIYIRARKSVNPHQMSDSDSEATDDDTREAYSIVQNPARKRDTAYSETLVIRSNLEGSGKQCSLHRQGTGQSMDDSIETVESLELFSENSQSISQDQSKDSLFIEDFPDTDQENTETEVDHDRTLILGHEDRSPPKQISGEKEPVTPECTPRRPGVSRNLGVNATPPQTEEEMIHHESVVAMRLFSPKFQKASKLAHRKAWTCGECNTRNDPGADDCDGCLAERPEYPQLSKVPCDELQSSQSRKCKECDWENIGPEIEKCEMCCAVLGHVKDDKVPINGSGSGMENVKEESQDLTSPVQEEEPRRVNIDKLPVYRQFQYLCSLNTDRIYLYDEVVAIPFYEVFTKNHTYFSAKVVDLHIPNMAPHQKLVLAPGAIIRGNTNGAPMNLNFLPIDVQMDCFGNLPDVLLHPENLRLVKRFLREWNSLTATKRRMIVKSGIIFSNPVLMYKEISSKTKPSKERYTSKSTGALLAINKANEIGGSVRVLTRPIHQMMSGKSNKKKTNISSDVPNEEFQSPSATNCSKILNVVKGVVQTMDKDGNPLCIHCQNTYDTKLISETTRKENPWYTRFCSKKCMDEYWMRHNRQYSKQQVFEAERGVCQSCNFNCQVFFERMRITKDLQKRAQLIQETQYKTLKAEVKQKMVKNPHIGQFWQADHIVPVAHGGGECDIDNLRTLCTVCHLKVTAEQHRNKAAVKRLEAAPFNMDITSFFQPVAR